MKTGKRLGLLLLLLCLSFSAGAVQAHAASTSAQAKDGKWVRVSAGKKYRCKDGSYAKSRWLKINGNYYYFLSTGLMAKNQMVTTSGKTYYVKATGARVTSSWISRGGKTYYFGADGVRVQNAWAKRNGVDYYLGAEGTILVNQWVDHGRYYVKANGTRARNCVKDGYYLNANGKKTVKVFAGDYIFVGDSRMVGMKKVIAPSNTLYLAKNGQGYAWLKRTAGVTLRYYLKANPKVKVVLALGVNDLKNVNSYIAYYKKLIKEFPKTKFYILSVNPVDEVKEAIRGFKIKNTSIVAFNRKMQKAFGSKFVNTYKKMKADGFDTRDGLHYVASDYKKLYRTITAKIS